MGLLCYVKNIIVDIIINLINNKIQEFKKIEYLYFTMIILFFQDISFMIIRHYWLSNRFLDFLKLILIITI